MTMNQFFVAFVVAVLVVVPGLVGRSSEGPNSDETRAVNPQFVFPSEDEQALSRQAEFTLRENQMILYQERMQLLSNGHVVEHETAGFHQEHCKPHTFEGVASLRESYLPDDHDDGRNYYQFHDYYSPSAAPYNKSLHWERAFPKTLASNIVYGPDLNHSGRYSVTCTFGASAIKALSELLGVDPGSQTLADDGVDWAGQYRLAGHYITNYLFTVVMDNVAFKSVSLRKIVADNAPSTSILLADDLSLELAEQMADRLSN